MALASAAQAAEPNPCVGALISSVEVTGCPESLCPRPMPRQLATLTDLGGATATVATVELARRRLEAVGLFRAITFHCRDAGSGTAARIEVLTNSFVRDVIVEGNLTFFETDIRKRVFLRPGAVLNAVKGKELEDPEVRRQVDSIKRLYLKEGLEDVVITPTIEEASPHTRDLRLEIDERLRSRVRKLRVLRDALPPGELRCPEVQRRSIELKAGIDVGDVYTTKKRKEIRRTLRQWLQSVGYERPQVEVDFEAGTGTLELTVRTTRCWLLRVWERDSEVAGASKREPAFRFSDPVGNPNALAAPGERSGYRRIDLELWREVLPFGESGIFDQSEAARGVNAIYERLQERGYLFADVALERRRLPRKVADDGNSVDPVAGVLDYLITHNYPRRIQAITFPGAKTFDIDQLHGLLDTHTYDFLEGGGNLIVDRVLVDLKKIQRHYRDSGFYEFEYALRGSPQDKAPRRRFEPGDDWLTWEYRFRDRGFRVRKRPSEMVVYLEVPLREGPRTRTRQIAIEGAETLGEAEAHQRLGLLPDTAYGSRALRQGLVAIRRFYQRRGHPNVAVEARCRGYEPDISEELCNPDTVAAKAVDITVRVDEGPRVLVGERFWRGNYKTNPSVVLRDLPKPGEPYSKEAIAEAQRRLRDLGVFDSVRIDVIGLEGETASLEGRPRETVALLVALEEADTEFVNVAAGFRSVQREGIPAINALVGSLVGQSITRADQLTSGTTRAFELAIPDILVLAEVEYLNTDAFGVAHELRLPLRAGLLLNRLLSVPWDDADLLSFEPTWAEPRLGGSDVRLEIKLLGEIDRVTEVFDRTELSASANVTFRVSRLMALNLETKGGMLRFESSTTDTDLQPQVLAAIRWTFDSHDNPVHPRRGAAVSVGVSGILNRDVIGNELLFNEFAKWEVSAKGTISAATGPIFAGLVRYGGSTADAVNPLPPNERFFLGGSNGMRGFADNAMGRYDAQGELIPQTTRLDFGGNVLLNANLETRIPLIDRAGLWGVLFADMGALAASHDEIFGASFRFSLGAGIRWLIANQIPVRFDVGFVAGELRCLPTSAGGGDDPDGVDTCLRESRAHVHFGFLYPF